MIYTTEKLNISLLIEVRSPGGPEGAYYLCVFNIINDGNYYY